MQLWHHGSFGGGPSHWKGSIYQKEAMFVARYYQDEYDDFILPRLEMEQRPDGQTSLHIDGNLLCIDIDKHYRIHKRKIEKGNKKRDAYLDVSEVAKEVDNLDE